ncbi:unnamed protein product [Didymodactylos carnosus]|uniref:Macro domain-containing protein n=1 Tax=Didymodactylos carnosus TaxID=1234261 RepID=A0A8S2JMY9_9BILA|nr:unnamed protein product [Didymodactylos carnosus]CAF3818317.1 unnamed protein product [Didymodactylos carnosus]
MYLAGEARLTKGYELLASYVIHAVGPRYNPKYQSSCVDTLHLAYKNCLQICSVEKFKTVVIPPIHNPSTGFPLLEGTHVALRTIRRYLDKHHEDFERLIIGVNEQEMATYNHLMPLYFPRTTDEASRTSPFIPIVECDEYGGIVHLDRQIRIGGNLQSNRKESDQNDETENVEVNENIQNNENVILGQKPSEAISIKFHVPMEDDIDSTRKRQVLNNKEPPNSLQG